MNEWIAVVTITIFAVISPGPDFAMTSRNALSLSRRAGFLTAFGISAGVLVHVAYALLGIGWVFKNAPDIFEWMKFIGAIYLIWLGTKLIFSSKTNDLSQMSGSLVTDWSAFRTGFWTNALNPKTSIFIISLFLQIVDVQTDLLTRAAYGLFVSWAHMIWFSAVVLFFSNPIIQSKVFAFKLCIDRIFGLLLIGFGISLSLSDLEIG